jgi:hypothetical protein
MGGEERGEGRKIKLVEGRTGRERVRGRVLLRRDLSSIPRESVRKLEGGREERKRTEHQTNGDKTMVVRDETGEATAETPGGDHQGDTDVCADCKADRAESRRRRRGRKGEGQEEEKVGRMSALVRVLGERGETTHSS